MQYRHRNTVLSRQTLHDCITVVIFFHQLQKYNIYSTSLITLRMTNKNTKKEFTNVAASIDASQIQLIPTTHTFHIGNQIIHYITR